MNHQITYLLQDIFNLVPDLTTTSFVKSINVNTNDQMLVIYAASLIRSIIALHNLINNKLTNKEAERKEAGGSAKDSVKKENEKEKSEKSDKNKDSKDSDKGEKSKSDKKWGQNDFSLYNLFRGTGDSYMVFWVTVVCIKC